MKQCSNIIYIVYMLYAFILMEFREALNGNWHGMKTF